MAHMHNFAGRNLLSLSVLEQGEALKIRLRPSFLHLTKILFILYKKLF